MPFLVYATLQDQGFGYYWPKYLKKSVSILFGKKLEQWGEGEDGNVVLQHVINDPFKNYSSPILHDQQACNKYLCDHHHFDAVSKPWMHGPPEDVDYNNPSNVKETMLQDARKLWWAKLYDLNNEWSMGVNITHWGTTKSAMPLPYRWKHGMQLLQTHAAVQAGIATEEELEKLINS